MVWSLTGEMLWGELRGATGLDWGPLAAPAVSTKDGRNWFSLHALYFYLTVLSGVVQPFIFIGCTERERGIWWQGHRVVLLVQYCDITLPPLLCFTISKPAGSFSRPQHKQAWLSWSTRKAIYHASESEQSFITEMVWNVLGWCSSWRLSVTVFIHTEESGNLGASWKLLTWTWWLFDRWIIKQVLLKRESYLPADKHVKNWSKFKLDIIWNDSGRQKSSLIVIVIVIAISCLDCFAMNSRFTTLIIDCNVTAFAQQNKMLQACSLQGRGRDRTGLERALFQKAGSNAWLWLYLSKIWLCLNTTSYFLPH